MDVEYSYHQPATGEQGQTAYVGREAVTGGCKADPVRGNPTPNPGVMPLENNPTMATHEDQAPMHTIEAASHPGVNSLAPELEHPVTAPSAREAPVRDTSMPVNRSTHHPAAQQERQQAQGEGPSKANADQEGPSPTPEGSSSLTLDQIYQQIMSQKKAAEAVDDRTTVEPLLSGQAPSLKLSLRQSALERIFTAAGEDGTRQPAAAVMRSNTMENILRTMSGARELDELMFDWSSLPQDKFLEGLQTDMKEIEAQPPDVKDMRRTFTIERILSGAEGDLQQLAAEANAANASEAAAGFAHTVLPGASNVSSHPAGMSLDNNASGPMLQPPMQMGLHQPRPGGYAGRGHAAGTGLQHQDHMVPQYPALSSKMSEELGGGQIKRAGAPLSPGLGHGPKRTKSGTLLDLAAMAEHMGNGAPQSLDVKMAVNAQKEVEKLERDNAMLQQQLDVLLAQIDSMQQNNNYMKTVLLETCVANGINADMQQLNATIAMHRPQPMGSTEASHIAASVLQQSSGDVMGTVQQLMTMAMNRLRNS